MSVYGGEPTQWPSDLEETKTNFTTKKRLNQGYKISDGGILVLVLTAGEFREKIITLRSIPLTDWFAIFARIVSLCANCK